MTPGGLLPEGFEALDPYVESWAIEGSDERMRRRLASTASERQAFYDAASPLLPSALAYLDSGPLDDGAEPRQRLLDLMLSLAHVAMAVEQQQEREPIHAGAQQVLAITRSSADFE